MRRGRLLLGGIFFLAILLRCLFIDTRNIQYDDAFSILLSARPIGAIIEGTAADTMPPLFYFLLHFWQKISLEIWFLRLLSVLFSLGTIAFLYGLVKSIAGEKAALWAAFLAGISPLQIYHSQDIRMYAAVAFFLSGYSWFFYNLFKENPKPAQKWMWVGLVLFAVGALYTHNLAIFGIVAPNIFLILKKKWTDLKNLVLAQVLAGILFVPWLLYLPGQIAKIQNAFWTPKPGIVEIMQAIIMFSANLPLNGLSFVIAILLAVEVFVLVIMEQRRNRTLLGIDYLWLAAAVPPIALFLVSYLMRPVFVPRGFLISALAFDGMAGVAIANQTLKPIKGLLIASFVCLSIITLIQQIPYDQFPRSPFQQAATYLRQEVPAGDLVLHDNKLSYFPMVYFDQKLLQKFVADPAGTANDTLALGTLQALGMSAESSVEAAASGFSTVYFVVFREAIDENSPSEQNAYAPIDGLSKNYQLSGTKIFNDLEIWKFQKKSP